jgi:hypothetical protein
MKYKIEQQYCWYKLETKWQIVLMFYISGVPFTFNELTEVELNDPKIVELANKNIKWEVEDLYIKSVYLIEEECHPLLFELEIENPEELMKIDMG